MTWMAVIHAEVFTPATRLAQGLVLIAADRIQAVGHSHEVPLPPDIRLLDAEGAQIVPALIDLAWPEETPPPPGTGIARFARAISIQSEADLAVVAAAAASLAVPTTAAQPLGLHLILRDAFPAWEAIRTAAGEAIALVTLPTEHPQTPTLAQRLWQERRRFLLAGPAPTDPFLRELIYCGLAATTDPEVPCSARSWLVTPSPGPSATARPLLMSHRGQTLTAAVLGAPTPDPTRLLATTQHPATFLRLASGQLLPGAKADLLCRNRAGEVLWLMVDGRLLA